MATDTEHPGAQDSAEPGTTRPPVDVLKVRAMLVPLEHERLVDLLADLAGRQPAVYDHLKATLRSDQSQRRLFVRGLARECTNEDLLAAFLVHGPIDEAVVMKEKGTQSCKGFGFVTYTDADSADACMLQPEKMICGRLATCNLAVHGASRHRPAAAMAPQLQPTPSPYMTYSSYPPQHQFQPATHIDQPKKRYRDDASYQPLYQSYPPPSPAPLSAQSPSYSTQPPGIDQYSPQQQSYATSNAYQQRIQQESALYRTPMASHQMTPSAHDQMGALNRVSGVNSRKMPF